jgi:hypothetical protein
MGEARVFDGKSVIFSWGPIIAVGLIEADNAIEIEPEADLYDDEAGTDGEVARYKSNDRRATITLRLMKTSPTNDLLQIQANLDRNTPNGLAIYPIIVKDMNGTEFHMAPKAWIKRYPKAANGMKAGPREWVFRTNEWIPNFGGNNAL